MEKGNDEQQEYCSLKMEDYYYSVVDEIGLGGEFINKNSSSNSLGFMELLNMQDFGPGSFFDVLPQEPLMKEAVVLGAPGTPNCSSISSESSGPAAAGHRHNNNNNDHHHHHHEQQQINKTDPSSLVDGEEEEDDDEEEEEEHNKKTPKQLKTKKTTSQKKKKKNRQREARFAFMTKSEVDHLEDGYRWRKYGQKAVKNSPFPRSYYRCTNASCNVKKRVERSFNDPSIVVTTYEGQHTHPSPAMPRLGLGSTAAAYPSFSGYSCGGSPFTQQMLLSQLNHTVPLNNHGGGGGGGYNNIMGFPNAAAGMISAPHHLRFTPPTSGDHGLLQDIVPAWSTHVHVKKEG